MFLCLLAYYLQWHLKQRLAPLFAQDGPEKHRRWSWANVLERLKAIRQERVKLNGIQCNQLTTPEADQPAILDLLNVTLEPSPCNLKTALSRSPSRVSALGIQTKCDKIQQSP